MKAQKHIYIWYENSQMVSILIDKSEFYVLFQPARTFNMQNSPEY